VTERTADSCQTCCGHLLCQIAFKTHRRYRKYEKTLLALTVTWIAAFIALIFTALMLCQVSHTASPKSVTNMDGTGRNTFHPLVKCGCTETIFTNSPFFDDFLLGMYRILWKSYRWSGTPSNINERTDVGFVEGLTVAHELRSDNYMQLRHQWNRTGRRHELQAQSCFKSKAFLLLPCKTRNGAGYVRRQCIRL